MTFSAAAVSHAAVLRAIQAGPHPTLAALARAAGHDNNKSIGRDVEQLARDELISGDGADLTVTDIGLRSLAAIDFFEQGGRPGDAGAPELPPGVALLTADQLKPGHNARRDSGLSDESIQEMADSIAAIG